MRTLPRAAKFAPVLRKNRTPDNALVPLYAAAPEPKLNVVALLGLQNMVMNAVLKDEFVAFVFCMVIAAFSPGPVASSVPVPRKMFMLVLLKLCPESVAPDPPTVYRVFVSAAPLTA
jgi:hypothetical protein